MLSKKKPKSPEPEGPQAEDRSKVDPIGPKLGDLLRQEQLVTEDQLNEALLQQTVSGKRIGTLLVELGALDEDGLARTIAKQFGVKVADLRRRELEKDALALIPESLARAHTVVPLARHDGILEVAMADPAEGGALEHISQTTGLTIDISVAPPSDILRMIDSAYRALTGVEAQVEAFQAAETTRKTPTPQLDTTSADAPIVRVVHLIITQGLRDRASDIHLEPQEDRLRVRFRIDGALHDVLALPVNMAPAIVSRTKIMANMNIVERQRPQDGAIEMNIEGRDLDIRVSTTPTIWGEKAVLRLLDKSKPLFRLDDLGMADDIQVQFAQVVRAPFGMVLCAGPTGSGKTTTLYATLSEINDTRKNVMTIEDPVEYVFPSINQIQIKETAGVTFAGGLKSILRQDPDIILVGEIRDVETARIAVQSALTGHFVMSSIHATDAVSALHRFLDMGIESFMIASAITGILGQRLVRRICLHCRAPYQPTPEEESFFIESGGRKGAPLLHGEGCNFCAHTGYQERIGVYEFLTITDELKQLIVRHATHDKLFAQAVKQGMRPLRREAIRLVEEGVTTVGEILRSIHAL